MAVVHVISLAHFSLSYARGWAADSVNTRVRLKAENDRLRQEVALLREELRPRFDAVGKYGSLAVIERLILTVKLLLGYLPLVPLGAQAFRREVALVLGWYNEHRPHATLGGRTPDEVYFRRFPANRKPRFQPRYRWPRGSPCAWPWALLKGKPGAWVELEVEFLAGRKHLPIVKLRRAA